MSASFTTILSTLQILNATNLLLRIYGTNNFFPPPHFFFFFFSKQGLSTDFLLHGNQQVYILIFFLYIFGLELYLGWDCHFLKNIRNDVRFGTF